MFVADYICCTSMDIVLTGLSVPTTIRLFKT
jgi:hypothetical protein